MPWTLDNPAFLVYLSIRASGMIKESPFSNLIILFLKDFYLECLRSRQTTHFTVGTFVQYIVVAIIESIQDLISRLSLQAWILLHPSNEISLTLHWIIINREENVNASHIFLIHMYLNTSWKIELKIIKMKSMIDDNVHKLENIFQIPWFFYSIRYKKNKFVHVENVTAMLYWFSFWLTFTYRFLLFLDSSNIFFYDWSCFCCHLFWILKICIWHG